MLKLGGGVLQQFGTPEQAAKAVNAAARVVGVYHSNPKQAPKPTPEQFRLGYLQRYLRLYLTAEPEAGTPLPAHAHWRLAQALEKQDKKEEAIAELEQAVKAKPDFTDAKKDLKRLKRRA